MPPRSRKTAARRASKPTTAPRKQALDLYALIPKYVDVILDVGLNLQPGQRLLIVNNLYIGVDVSLAPFVRLVTKGAYRRGASFVDVVWGDPQLELLRLKEAPRDSIRSYPKWPSAARLEHVLAADAYLALRGDDPELLSSVDPSLIADYLAAIREPAKQVMAYMFRNVSNWCVATVSTHPWAARVLPEVPQATRVPQLWELILEASRLDRPDPVAHWRTHIADLGRRRDYLNRKQYAALQYSGPGTHLKVGLPPGHIWNGGQMTAENGITFVPNLPTEEVFTLPHRAGVEGEVSASKPLVYSGNSIEGMHLKFSAGRVVQASARKGQGMLDQLLRTDEGASHLGEVALVPDSSPISRMGVTFQSTLIDENAASHLALGQAYRFTLQDALTISDEAFAQRGGNTSKVHSDFMVGSGQLDIDGVLPDGTTEPVMRRGEWAFKV